MQVSALACVESRPAARWSSPSISTRPGQVVIAGHAAAVRRAIDACKARGAKRAVLLPMSVPAHSSLMQPAARCFGERLATCTCRPGDPLLESGGCGAMRSRRNCARCCSASWPAPCAGRSWSARWPAPDITRFVECGPGKILTSLNRRIERRADIECVALEDPASLAAGAGQYREP